MKNRFLVLLVLLMVSGCKAGYHQTGATEYGVTFRNLPKFLGGGIASGVNEPGGWFFVAPWDEVMLVDTAVKEISWGFKENGHIAARALDGNEVALAMSVRYQVMPNPAGLTKIVDLVGSDPTEIENFVRSSTTAAVRLSMNELHTNDFLKTDNRYKAVDKVKAYLKGQLNPFNIDITSINLDDFRFERTLEDGKIDASYQDKLNETQRIREETEREKARIDTIVAQKEQESNDVQAKVNRQIAEAEGYKKQAESRGDSYLEARKNEAQSILAVGQAEAKGLEERVQALSGIGGKALVKLEIVKNLLKANPKFFVVGSGSGQNNGSAAGNSSANTLEVRRTDTNQLLDQAGIFEGMQSRATIDAPHK